MKCFTISWALSLLGSKCMPTQPLNGHGKKIMTTIISKLLIGIPNPSAQVKTRLINF